MGNKSKSSASKYRVRQAEPEKAFDPKASRVNRLETADDAFAEDGEDGFHRNRDSILLERDGADSGEDFDEVSDPDEVYGLDLPSSQADSGEEDDEMDDEEDDDAIAYYDKEDDLPEAPRGRFAKTANGDQDKLSNASDEEDEEEAAKGASSDEEDTWAPGSYHASRRAPGEADSSDDEALELEAAEALRLQKLSRGKLGGEDFGFEEGAEETLAEQRAKARAQAKLEEAGEAPLTVKAGGKLSEEEAIAFLVREQPETLALLDDFTATAQRIKSVEADLEVVRQGADDGKEHPALAIMELEHQALSTYLPTLAFYFSLLLSPAPSQELLKKVVHRLAALRKALATMEELDLTSTPLEDFENESDSDDSHHSHSHSHSHSDEEESVSGDEEEEMLASELWDLNADAEKLAALDAESDSEEGSEDDEELELESGEEMMSDYDSDEAEEATDAMLMGMSNEELELLMEDMAGDEDAELLIARVKQIQRQKLGLPPLKEDDESMSEEVKELPKPKKSKKKPKEVVIPELAPLASTSKRKLSAAAPTATADDFIDPQALSRTDQADKASKRHTLRFHVSQVHQKQAKREAKTGAVGGDDDLPRRSKERSRREVLKRQEHGGVEGAALDDADWDEDDKKAARAVKGTSAGGQEDDFGGDDDGDYYDLVKMEKEEGRRSKKARYDEERAAEKEEIMSLADGLADGPRGASRMILKNKGLTPRRKKENRNSRVKKRLQYEKAKKKVSSMKSQYTGNHGASYEGEKSGIAKGVSKSVKLGK